MAITRSKLSSRDNRLYSYRSFGNIVGGVISPLLANLYMRRFVLGWKTLGHEQRLRAYLVNYADDFVICCCGTAAKALAAMREMMERLRLTVNETKTRVRRLPEETFDFLGYTFGRYYTFGTGQPYLAMRPSRKSIHRLCRSIREETARPRFYAEATERVQTLNRILSGWANYFCLGPVGRVYEAVDRHARQRLRQWLQRKHKQPGRGYAQVPTEHLYQTLGLVSLSRRRRIVSWAWS